VTEPQPSGRRALRPRARLLRTIGSDLISSEKVAVLELVKNSYDADASAVLIKFTGPLEIGKGRIDVFDDGHGMDVQTLQDSWLDIATGAKLRATTSETKKRRMLGEKGIGRFAVARLGSDMLLTTKRQDSGEIELLIDWTEFDRPDAYLDEVEVAWAVDEPRVYSGPTTAADEFRASGVDDFQMGQGTSLQIDRLTLAWAEPEFLELRTALARLIRPRPSNAAGAPSPRFRIFMQLPEEYSSLSGEVESPDELDKPLYSLAGTVDSAGIAQLRYTQLDPLVDRTYRDHRLWTVEGGPPSAGPFELDLQVWDRDSRGIRKVFDAGPLSRFRQLLDEVAGVSVYRDGFRVLPFGESGDDWLELDRRRVQNPTLRLSNNQVIGHVFVGADDNASLRDQSNREGLLHGSAYKDLKTMLESAIGMIEVSRYEARRPVAAERTDRSGLFEHFNLNDVRTALAAKYPQDTLLIGLLDEKNKDIREGVEEVQQVLSRYSRLATLGSLIDRILHDGRSAVTQLKNTVRFSRRDLVKATLTDVDKLALMGGSLDIADTSTDQLSMLFDQIEPFGGRKRGRPKSISIRDVAEKAVALYRAEASEKSVALEVAGEDTEVLVDESEVLTVLVNLIQNALHWVVFTPKESGRRVLVSVRRDPDGSVALTVSDNGPGVPPEFRDTIFDSYVSNRPNGTGLGLSIAGTIVHDLYAGSLALLDDGPLDGATFEATLRKRV
jgi:signal transduction histidine kinase